MSSRTLKEKQTERSRKRRERETRDAIAKLKARPSSPVVLGFPLEAEARLDNIVRDDDGVFWKRNQAHTGWEKFLDEGTDGEDGATLSINIVSVLPPIPTTGKAAIVWFEGQLWGSATGETRWYPAMRFTENDGTP